MLDITVFVAMNNGICVVSMIEDSFFKCFLRLIIFMTDLASARASMWNLAVSLHLFVLADTTGIAV